MKRHPLLEPHGRVALGHWPTPFEPADRLRTEIGGPRIWIKRDDCSGLAVGGNKTRKLEYLLAPVLDGAARVVTYGALQSNHARQTAAACARLGLRCDLVLERQVKRDDEHYLASGNLLLDRVLGASVHEVDGPDGAADVVARLRADARDAGERLVEIPMGGSSAIGVLGYVDGTIELAGQLAAAELAPARIVVGGSTFGTAAGIVLGAALSDLGAVVDIACVAAPTARAQPIVRRLLAEAADLIGCPVPADDRWLIDDQTLGPGYGVVTDEVLTAIDTLARTEGILLDPVYTAKAFAHLLGRVRRGELDASDDVVFVHTGGAPGLFAYAEEWAE